MRPLVRERARGGAPHLCSQRRPLIHARRADPRVRFSELAQCPTRAAQPFRRLIQHSVRLGEAQADDGSRDRTADVAREAASRFGEEAVHVERYEPNRGKGFAVKTGLLAARSADMDDQTPSERPITSFMISVVPP